MGLEHLHVGLGPLLLLERRSRDFGDLDDLADPAVVVVPKRVDCHLEGLAVHDALHGLGVRRSDVLGEDGNCNQRTDGQRG